MNMSHKISKVFPYKEEKIKMAPPPKISTNSLGVPGGKTGIYLTIRGKLAKKTIYKRCSFLGTTFNVFLATIMDII